MLYFFFFTMCALFKKCSIIFVFQRELCCFTSPEHEQLDPVVACDESQQDSGFYLSGSSVSGDLCSLRVGTGFSNSV